MTGSTHRFARVLAALAAVAGCKSEPPAPTPSAPAAPPAEAPHARSSATPPSTPDPIAPLDERFRALDAMEEPPFAGLSALVTELYAATLPTDPTQAAKLELLRVRALARTLDVLAPVGDPSDAEQAFLKAHESRIVDNTLAGRHFVDAGAAWKLAEKYAATPSADGLAWLAARTPLNQECEGYVPCMLARAEMTDGDYLKRFPSGANVGEALAMVRQAVPPPDDEGLTQLDAADIKGARETLKTLLDRVRATSHAEKAATVAALEGLDALLAKATPAK